MCRSTRSSLRKPVVRSPRRSKLTVSRACSALESWTSTGRVGGPSNGSSSGHAQRKRLRRSRTPGLGAPLGSFCAPLSIWSSLSAPRGPSLVLRTSLLPMRSATVTPPLSNAQTPSPRACSYPPKRCERCSSTGTPRARTPSFSSRATLGSAESRPSIESGTSSISALRSASGCAPAHRGGGTPTRSRMWPKPRVFAAASFATRRSTRWLAGRSTPGDGRSALATTYGAC